MAEKSVVQPLQTSPTSSWGFCAEAIFACRARNVSGLPYFLSLSVRDQPAVEAVSNLNGKFTDTRFASPHSNITTRAPLHPHHTPARNADFSDPRTCCFQGGSTRPASLMEFLRKSSCSSTSQASTGPLLPSYLPRALTSIPACSGNDVGFFL